MPLFFRSLRPIGAMAVLIFLLHHMVSSRMESLSGSTLIGTVIGWDVQRGRNSKTTSYPILQYTLPSDWPVAAGTPRTFKVPWTSSSASYNEMGTEVQLKLPRTGDFEPLVFSFQGFWIPPLVTLALGSAIIFMLAAVEPGPSAHRLGVARERPKKPKVPFHAFTNLYKRAKKSTEETSDEETSAAELVTAAIALQPEPIIKRAWLAFSDKIPPNFRLLLACLIAPFLLMAAPFVIIASSLYGIILRVLHVLKPDADAACAERVGFMGLALDLIQSTSLIGLMCGFALGCGYAGFHAADAVAGKLSWSLAPINRVRTIVWLPQDFDDAYCAARKRQDAYAQPWLLAHGARQNIVCVAQPKIEAESDS